MRRVVAIAILLCLAATSLAGCRRLVPEDDSITVYATFYPIYALTEGVLRDVPDAALHCLVQPQDGCLRGYRLSDWDAALLEAGASAVLMGGRGLESFEDTLFQWSESGSAVSAVLYNLELYEQRPAGVDPEAESHLQGPNPHLYMSLEGAKEIVRSVSATMMSLDPGYAERYAENAEAAADRLDAALAEARRALSAYAGRPVVLMNEALVYVARDYDLEAALWIDRESGASLVDNELSACLEKLRSTDARVVLIERQAPQALVDALEAAGYAVARLDVLSTHREGEGFDAYLEYQSGNARALLDALQRADAKEDNP